MSASATGGNGGNAYFVGSGNVVGNGGAGGSATIANAVTGTSSGALNLSETATGGAYSEDNFVTAGTGGAGGAASATMTTTDTTATSVTTSVSAFGGEGGGTDYGTPGAGGSATATLSVSSTSASSVSGTATATGGMAGSSTTAIPYLYGQAATPRRRLRSLPLRVAPAAMRQPTRPAAMAPALKRRRRRRPSQARRPVPRRRPASRRVPLGTVITTATAPVGGPASAITEANISSPLQAVALSEGEVYSVAEVTPGGPSFAVGGFGAESDGSDTSLTYDATADLTFVTTTTEDIFLN